MKNAKLFNTLNKIAIFYKSEVLKLDLKMISHLSNLSKLSFTDNELEKLSSDMSSIIEIVDIIKEVDIVYNPLSDNKNVNINDLREDVAKESIATEKILMNAINSDNCFVVPKVVE